MVTKIPLAISEEVKDALGQSLGYKLIFALTNQLEGTIDIDGQSGSHVAISMSKYQKYTIKD